MTVRSSTDCVAHNTALRNNIRSSAWYIGGERNEGGNKKNTAYRKEKKRLLLCFSIIGAAGRQKWTQNLQDERQQWRFAPEASSGLKVRQFLFSVPFWEEAKTLEGSSSACVWLSGTLFLRSNSGASQTLETQHRLCVFMSLQSYLFK